MTVGGATQFESSFAFSQKQKEKGEEEDESLENGTLVVVRPSPSHIYYLLLNTHVKPFMKESSHS